MAACDPRQWTKGRGGERGGAGLLAGLSEVT